ncbi:MAG: hypothetical protein NTW87_07785 [Planctomycetota bacterium]|nr:hypothetical protein [Planctomycetota bacterium]
MRKPEYESSASPWLAQPSAARAWCPAALPASLACCLSLLLAAPAPARAGEPPQPDGANVGELIKQLGADDFVQREAASKALAETGEAILAELLAARKTSDDAERSARLDRLIGAITSRPLDHWLKQWNGTDPKGIAQASTVLDYLFHQALANLQNASEAVVAGGDRRIPVGSVLAVKPDAGLVMISVGKQQDVKPGMIFTVSRGGSFVAQVRIDRTYPDMSSAKVVPGAGNGEIKVQDSVRYGDTTFAGVQPSTGTVLLRLGEGHDVKPGAALTILREDKDVGEAKVESVFKGGCTAKLVPAADTLRLQGNESFKVKK